MTDLHCDRCGYDYPANYAQTRFGAPESDGLFVIEGVCGYCEFAAHNDADDGSGK